MESKQSKSITQKLGLNKHTELVIWNVPKESSLLEQWKSEGLWSGINDTKIESYDSSLIVFVITHDQIDSAFEKLTKQIEPKLFWIFYPKKTSKIKSDLNLMYNWQTLIPQQWAPCGSAAIDEDWTALKFKKADQVKVSGLGNAQIKESELSRFIDIDNKAITLPKYIEDRFSQSTCQVNLNQSCLDFFYTLSYSNKKEYLLWILSAKQISTQQSRLDKSVYLLSLGAKNPADKK